MSDLSPYEKLGVTEDASFEEIQNTKKRLTQKYQHDPQVLETIEAAYDAIIMDRLRMRQEGKIKVPDQIRFPEKILETEATSLSNSFSKGKNQTPSWLQNLIDTPSPREVSLSGVVFLVLAMVSVFAQTSDILPLLLTIGVGTNFYFLYRKEKLFWRATGITFVVLIVGIGLGSILANLIMSSDFNLSLQNDQFVSLFSFCLFWLISNFLR
jgi:hypothetical protein